MIIDVNSWFGHWPSYPVLGDIGSVHESLKATGVDVMFMSSLDAIWSRNPHSFNKRLYAETAPFETIYPTPIITPTIASWQDELRRAVDHPRVRMVKLLPNYSQFELQPDSEFGDALAESGLAVFVQITMEDVRRQHPLGKTAAVDLGSLFEFVIHYRQVPIVGGGLSRYLMDYAYDLLRDVDNFFVETSLIDGFDSIRHPVENEKVGHKLLFATHAPLLCPGSAMPRVLAEVNDVDATAILSDNARRLFSI